MTATDLAQVLAYHQRSKHHPGRYAASLGYLDWDTQPNPFRIYTGAPAIALPRTATPTPRWPELFAKNNHDAVPPAPLDAALLDGLLLHSLALSAWKQSGASRWSLRVNPSSGNLHPTEAYLISPALPGLSAAPGLYHYSPLLHALERRADLPAELWTTLTADLPQPCLLVGLSSIAWREAWKYGERAFRYCQHDLGHAIAAIDLAAALHGWHALELPTPGDDQLAALLGLRDTSGPEPEVPEALLVLVPADLLTKTASLTTWTPPTAALTWFTQAELTGAPNQLSEAHQPWPAIEEVTHATRRPGPAAAQPPASDPTATPASETISDAAATASLASETPSSPASDASTLANETTSSPPSDAAGNPSLASETTPSPASDAPALAESPRAAALIRGRRSAVAMDGRTGVTRAGFYDMLLRTCPRARPLRALPGPARVDLAIFVHRVDGLDPGLYLLLRDPARREPWRRLADPTFAWTRPEGCPEALDLSLLRIGDGRQVAAAISCGQAIAADGAFALGMIADMRALADAPWLYRRLFWETGVIGQILYLEAEALGIAATGIGCFFDDRMHAMLGLQGPELQSLYHFTVGGRLEDDRLRTLDPYHHLEATK